MVPMAPSRIRMRSLRRAGRGDSFCLGFVMACGRLYSERRNRPRMSKIRFHIVPPIFKPEEKVFICGNLPELGAWNPEKALALKYNAPYHDAEIEVTEGAGIEYKIIRGSWETEAVDAYG